MVYMFAIGFDQPYLLLNLFGGSNFIPPLLTNTELDIFIPVWAGKQTSYVKFKNFLTDKLRLNSSPEPSRKVAFAPFKSSSGI